MIMVFPEFIRSIDLKKRILKINRVGGYVKVYKFKQSEMDLLNKINKSYLAYKKTQEIEMVKINVDDIVFHEHGKIVIRKAEGFELIEGINNMLQ